MTAVAWARGAALALCAFLSTAGTAYALVVGCGGGTSEGGNGGGTTPQQLSASGIPLACGAGEQYGAIGIGTGVVLGAHTPWQGDSNWTPEMNPFVGQSTSVTALAGSDAAGCPVVRVAADSGRFAWRIRDMQLGGAAPQRTGPSRGSSLY